MSGPGDRGRTAARWCCPREASRLLVVCALAACSPAFERVGPQQPAAPPAAAIEIDRIVLQ